MSQPIISVENLGKSYLVGHQSAKSERYTALRDVVGTHARSFVRKAIDMARGHQIVQGDEIEEFWALRDVSFEVQTGEVVGIIGRNGAGKSTLLKVLSRITEPTRGKVTLRGRVASLLEVGTGFHPELTGRENIFLNGAILGMTRAEIKAKFDEIVAFAEVERFLDTPVKRYSSGMYVRLAFAVAAHLEPEILVVDEVLAVGDATFQKKCLGKMSEVAKGGRTVLFVSHNLSAVQALCDRALLMKGGRLEASGNTSDMIGLHLTSDDSESDRQRLSGQDLGYGITLNKFSIHPAEPASGESVEITLSLLSHDATSFRHCCLILYSQLDTRVAVLDFRTEQTAEKDLLIQRLDIVCDVVSLALVEGDYRIGLYIVAANQSIDITDLCSLRVHPKKKPSEIVPYQSQYRGVMELEYSFQTRFAETTATSESFH